MSVQGKHFLNVEIVGNTFHFSPKPKSELDILFKIREVVLKKLTYHSRTKFDPNYSQLEALNLLKETTLGIAHEAARKPRKETWKEFAIKMDNLLYTGELPPPLLEQIEEIAKVNVNELNERIKNIKGNG
jgi:hypothetical protein